ncbi:GLPGLI family protein [Formosa sp. 3Alg 14/1]
MKYLFLVLTILWCSNSISQNGLVIYGHKQSMGMGAPIGIDYNATLQFNTERSLYIFAQDALEGGSINKTEIIRKNEKKTFVKRKFSLPEGFQYYIDRKTQTLMSRDLGLVYVKEPIPEMKWEISEDTKSIGQYTCTKATVMFRGRKYTAWFTTEIPLPYGPWKLQGLPGLILEAYDTDKEVYFYFKSIKYPLETTTAILALDPTTEQKDWISFAEYKQGLIEAHNRAIENGRMFMEDFDAEESTGKKSMAGSYIEVFDEN